MSSKTLPAKAGHDQASTLDELATLRKPNDPSPEGDDMDARLEALASPIRTRLYQRVHISSEREQHLFLVRRGTFLVRVSLPGDSTLITSLLFPGDVYHTGATLPSAAVSLITGSDAGELWRLRAVALEDQAARSRGIVHEITSRMAETAARQAFHTVVISALTGEERVAALFLELALRTGTPAEGGIAFEMPLTRTDVADYLALNADTVSRIFSRLRSKTLITTTSRNRLICPDVEALARECPLASVVTSLARWAQHVSAP